MRQFQKILKLIGLMSGLPSIDKNLVVVLENRPKSGITKKDQLCKTFHKSPTSLAKYFVNDCQRKQNLILIFLQVLLF